ncbi:MAG TPA: hypothetical protein VGB69_11245 [Edaphobacter sp.]
MQTRKLVFPITLLALSAGLCSAAQLSNDAKASIPREVQQIISVDYRAMQNSSAAMELKNRVLPPELKKLEGALKSSGLKVDQDADVLTFAAFRDGAQSSRIVGIAQGQFHTREIMANFVKNKIKPTMLRSNSIYPMGQNGMSVAFLNQTTMVFGDRSSLQSALDVRDGLQQSFLSNSEMVDQMLSVDQNAVWSILDQKGTQTMMQSVLGDASQLGDYDVVRDRMKTSRYTMDFQNGVKFDMAVVMSDTMTAATCATLLKGVSLLKKTQGNPLEKTALDLTTIDSNSGTLTVSYASSDSQFASLLKSPLFQSVVH